MDKKYWAKVILCIAGAGAATALIANASLTPKGLQIVEQRPSADAITLMDKVVLVDYKLAGVASQTVQSEFVIHNSSEQPINNVNVACEFYGAADKGDGKFLDREHWLISQTIPAGQGLKYTTADRRYINTSAKNFKCSITNFKIAKAPMFELHRVEGGHGGAEAEHGDSGHGSAAGGQH